MGCGGSAPEPVVMDPREGETFEALKDLQLYDSPNAAKKLVTIPTGKLMKVVSAELKEGFSKMGYVKVEFMGSQGWVSIWAPNPISEDRPKTSFVKRVDGGGADSSGDLAKAAPAAAQVDEKAVGA